MEVVGYVSDRIEIIDGDGRSIFFSTNSRNFDRIFYDLRKVIYELQHNDVFKRKAILNSGDRPWFSLSLNVIYSVILTVTWILKLDCCGVLKEPKKFVDTLVQKYFEYYEYYEKKGLLEPLCYGKARDKTTLWFKSILENGE